MKTTITAQSLKQLPSLLGKENALTISYSEWRLSNAEDNDQVEIDLGSTPENVLSLLSDKLPKTEIKARRLINRMLKMSEDPMGKIGRANIKQLPDRLAAFFRHHVQQNPNCYYMTTVVQRKGVAFLPLTAEFHEPRHRRDFDPYVTLTIGYNLNGVYSTRQINFEAHSLDQTIPQLLRSRGYVMMVDEDVKTFKMVQERYKKYLLLDKEQMLAVGSATEMGERHWWEEKTSHDLAPAGTPTKVVLDLEKSRHAERLGTMSELYGVQLKVPTHPMLPAFSLVHHAHIWISACHLKPYKYESLQQSLVLPASHSRLISALVSNLEVLKGVAGQSQILAAKSKSNVILSMGPPGTGKTLTAEVYAEEIKRPLYEIASGQLGTTPEEVESHLNECMHLAKRLNMPMLINECDVFIRERGDDIHQNAICAAFLRLTEYYTGLIFMTSNISKIDDAMRSRCIAEIQYEVPKSGERFRLWQVQLKQFGVEMSDKEIKRLVEVFPEVTGRDIQNLLKLTLRFAQATKSELTVDLFAEMAPFKSITTKIKAGL